MLDSLTLGRALQRQALKYGVQPAVVFDQSKCSFAQLFESGARLADALRQQGLEPGDRIAIIAPNSLAFLEVYAACEVGGFIASPLNERLAPAEWMQILESAAPRAVFFAGLDARVLELLMAGQPDVALWIGLEDNAYATFRKRGDPDRAAAAIQNRTHDEVVYLIHTSGTTGTPKGAMLTQGSQLGIACGIAESAGLNEQDAGLIVQPLFHVGAKFLQLAHLVAGARIELHRHFDPAAVWASLAAGGVTTLQLAPTMLEMLLAEAPEPLPKVALKALFYSAAPIQEALLRRAMDVFGRVFVQHYGSTEAGVVTTLTQAQHCPEGTEAEQRRLRSAGRATAPARVEIVDEVGSAVPPGEVGEIRVKHSCLFEGYWQNQLATAQAMSDGWLSMGDLGYLDEDGYLFIVDRKSDLIISGGENIYPREVEQVLLKHAAVRDCAVVGAPDDRWGETVLAEVVLENRHAVTADGLIEHCRRFIASFKKPTRIVFREELPRLANGKIDKVTIRSAYWPDHQRRI